MYAIFQRSTGYFLPERKKGERGYTHTEPTSESIRPPRLFVTKRAAKIARTYWLQGKFTEHWDYDTYDDYAPSIDVEKVVGRNSNDMIVVYITLIIEKEKE